MRTVTSSDGTPLAVDVLGDGPPLIMVSAAFNARASTAPLAAALQGRFTVFNFDRRGRGDSGDNPPYAVEREIEDIDAVIAEAGGTAAVFGHSSGATLALRAAARGLAISKLALYEAPFVVDGSRDPLPADFPERLAALVAEGRRGDAVELYQIEGVGMPREMVAQMREAPFRPGLEAIAHTLVYDAMIVGDITLPVDMLATISTPALVMSGENSPALLRNAARSLADALPNGELRVLAGQNHSLSADAIMAPLMQFLAG